MKNIKRLGALLVVLAMICTVCPVVSAAAVTEVAELYGIGKTNFDGVVEEATFGGVDCYSNVIEGGKATSQYYRFADPTIGATKDLTIEVDYYDNGNAGEVVHFWYIKNDGSMNAASGIKFEMTANAGWKTKVITLTDAGFTNSTSMVGNSAIRIIPDRNHIQFAIGRVQAWTTATYDGDGGYGDGNGGSSTPVVPGAANEVATHYDPAGNWDGLSDIGMFDGVEATTNTLDPNKPGTGAYTSLYYRFENETIKSTKDLVVEVEYYDTGIVGDKFYFWYVNDQGAANMPINTYPIEMTANEGWKTKVIELSNAGFGLGKPSGLFAGSCVIRLIPDKDDLIVIKRIEAWTADSYPNEIIPEAVTEIVEPYGIGGTGFDGVVEEGTFGGVDCYSNVIEGGKATSIYYRFANENIRSTKDLTIEIDYFDNGNAGDKFYVWYAKNDGQLSAMDAHPIEYKGSNKWKTKVITLTDAGFSGNAGFAGTSAIRLIPERNHIRINIARLQVWTTASYDGDGGYGEGEDGTDTPVVSGAANEIATHYDPAGNWDGLSDIGIFDGVEATTNTLDPNKVDTVAYTSLYYRFENETIKSTKELTVEVEYYDTGIVGDKFYFWYVNDQGVANMPITAIPIEMTAEEGWKTKVVVLENAGFGLGKPSGLFAGSCVIRLIPDKDDLIVIKRVQAWTTESYEPTTPEGPGTDEPTTPAPTTYTVSYDANGGAGSMASATVTEGEKLTLPANGFTAPDGKLFDGWDIAGTKYAVGAEVDITADTTVKALWIDDTNTKKLTITSDAPYAELKAGDEFTVTYSLVGQEGDSVRTFTFEIPYDNTKVSVENVSGYPMSFSVTGSKLKVLYADLSGGMNLSEAKDIAKIKVTVLDGVANGEVLAFAPALATYQVPGVAGNKTDVTINDETDIVIGREPLAPPAPTTYTVSYDANGGSGEMASATVEEGAEYTILANAFTAAEGYEFKAWEVNGVEKAAGDVITITADTTIKALWSEVVVVPTTYTVSYDANGGSGEMASATVEEGAEYTILENAFTAAEGYAFKAWEVNGVEKAAGDVITITADTVIKALWSEVAGAPETTYTITFDMNGGSGLTTTTVDKDAEFVLPSSGFTAPDAKELKAWEVNGVEKVAGDVITVTADITIKAIWKDVEVIDDIVYGDLNGDGAIDYDDIDLIINHYLEVAALTGDALLAADIDGNGDVDYDDIDIIINFYLEFITELPR